MVVLLLVALVVLLADVVPDVDELDVLLELEEDVLVLDDELVEVEADAVVEICPVLVVDVVPVVLPVALVVEVVLPDAESGQPRRITR